MKNINCWKLQFESCCYSDKLLSKLLLLNEQGQHKVDIEIVKKAIHYARKYHGEQKRQSGEPYYSHPLEVAYMIADYLFSTDVIVTAILHDTIEDTELTKEMIAKEFGELVAEQVMDLTRIKENGSKISSAEMVELLYQQKKYDVLMIKLFDRFHNMQTIGAMSPEKALKIARETLSRFISLSIYFRLPTIEQILIKLCSKVILVQDDYKQNNYDNFLLSTLTVPSKILHIYNIST